MLTSSSAVAVIVDRTGELSNRLQF